MKTTDNKTNPNKAIRVCTGPGCKGWGSNNLLQKLQARCSRNGREQRVCSSRCLNRCGGGATVVVGSCKSSVLKIRDTAQAVSQLMNYLPSAV